MSTIRRLYVDAREGVIVRMHDLTQVKDELCAELENVKRNCEGYADKQVERVREELTSLAKAAASTKDLEKACAGLLAEARTYAKECAVECSRQCKNQVDILHARHRGEEETARGALKAELVEAISSLAEQQLTAATALEAANIALNSKLETEFTSFKTSLDELRVDVLGKLDGKFSDILAEEKMEMDSVLSRLASIDESVGILEARTQTSTNDIEAIRKHLAQHSSQIGRLSQSVEDILHEQNQLARLSDMRDAQHRVAQLEGDTAELKECALESHNSSTRRVEWQIPDAVKRLQNAQEGSIFSPRFAAGGERGLQLEFRVWRVGERQADSHESGDCTVHLWASTGCKMAFRVFVGEVYSLVTEHDFASGQHHQSKRLWFLDDQVRQEDGGLHVGVEILESSRPGSLAIVADSEECTKVVGGQLERRRAVEGSLTLCRTVNNRMVENVEHALVRLRSHLLRRVEWRLEQASTLRSCYSEGKCICSVPFVAAGVEGMQLVFYPSGYPGARAGFCSLFLAGKGGQPPEPKSWLRAGRHRFQAQPALDCSKFFGRVNFCRFDGCIDTTDDTVLLVLEVEEAPQEVLAVGAQQDSWRTSVSTAGVKKSVKRLSNLRAITGKKSPEESNKLPELHMYPGAGSLRPDTAPAAGPREVRSPSPIPAELGKLDENPGPGALGAPCCAGGVNEGQVSLASDRR